MATQKKAAKKAAPKKAAKKAAPKKNAVPAGDYLEDLKQGISPGHRKK